MKIGATVEAGRRGLGERWHGGSRTSAKANAIGVWRGGAWSRRVAPDRYWRCGRPVAWGGAAPEGLDDDQAAAAAGTRVRERLWFVVGARRILIGLARARRHGEQFTGAGDVVAAGAAGEQTVMADAVTAIIAPGKPRSAPEGTG
jgi:hypothetical protein